jgi:uncharacterized phage-associated protein
LKFATFGKDKSYIRPMNNFFDEEKLFAAALYVIKKYNGDTDHHLIFKTLYEADKNHVAKYGRPITGDEYKAMKYGPVPYHLFCTFNNDANHKYFSSQNSFVEAKVEPDMLELSESDIHELDLAIDEIGKLNFWQRTDKSHDTAYNAVQLNAIMRYSDIARAANASDEMLKYIADK